MDILQPYLKYLFEPQKLFKDLVAFWPVGKWVKASVVPCFSLFPCECIRFFLYFSGLYLIVINNIAQTSFLHANLKFECLYMFSKLHLWYLQIVSITSVPCLQKILKYQCNSFQWSTLSCFSCVWSKGNWHFRYSGE